MIEFGIAFDVAEKDYWRGIQKSLGNMIDEYEPTE